MLAKLPDPLPGIRCHEKKGWLPTGFDIQCREILNKQVRAVLRKRMNIPEDRMSISSLLKIKLFIEDKLIFLLQIQHRFHGNGNMALS